MKKIFGLFLALTILTNSFASFNLEVPPKKATEIFFPVGAHGEKISLMELSQISWKEFETYSGRKMKLIDKLNFKLAQRELKKSINPDGTLNNKKIEKVYDKMQASDGFHLGGFALGFLLGIIGVLIAYIINDDKKRNRVKWSWIGLGAAVVLYLLFLAL